MIMNKKLLLMFAFVLFMPFTVFSKGLTATEYIEKIASDNGGNPNKSSVIGETSLAYDDTADKNLRYVGKNPNNYVVFNDEVPVLKELYVIHLNQYTKSFTSIDSCVSSYNVSKKYFNDDELTECVNNNGNYTYTINGDDRKLGYYTEEQSCIDSITWNYSPSNYDNFQCKKVTDYYGGWRIIGVMNNIDDGTGKKESRLKIQRAEALDDLSWDSLGDNDWTNSSLMKLLNPGYESSEMDASFYYNSTSGLCSYAGHLVGQNTECDYSQNGLKESSKEIIGDAVWNIGSNGSDNLYNYSAFDFYNAERSSNTDINCQGRESCNNKKTTWTGKVGLFYPSDFLYGTSGGNVITREQCLNKNILSWYDEYNDDCNDNNWLLAYDPVQWSIMPVASTSTGQVFSIYTMQNGYMLFNSTYEFGVRPNVYLKSDISIIAGDGTKENPYQLGYLSDEDDNNDLDIIDIIVNPLTGNNVIMILIAFMVIIVGCIMSIIKKREE